MVKKMLKEGLDQLVNPSNLACCGTMLVMDSMFMLPALFGAGSGEVRVRDEAGVVHIVEQYDSGRSIAENAISFYQDYLSEQLHDGEHVCRFEPTCSDYALQAIEKYGPIKGSALAAERVLRCNPLSKGGNDQLV